MKLKKFKERDNKRIGIIVFTIVCILLVSGVILYRTFAIFEVKTNQNVINGQVEKPGDIQFMVYVEGALTKDVPSKDQGYTLDTSKSHCENGNLVSWNDEKWSVEIKNISTTRTKCYLYFDKLYVEEELNGAIPDLGNKLIPITLDENGNAYKANLIDTESPWYSYTNQKWANAVILEEGEEDNYKAGDKIEENKIESYFVWIPRYSYQIFNDELYESLTQLEESRVQAVEIQFENKSTPIKNGSKNTEWLTHPAFTSFNSNGFWVGKFETGYDGATETSQAEQNEIAEDKIIIKPNVYSWRNINASKAFYNGYNYQRELDSHLMKNTEWGAVAYLSHSKYGYVGQVKENRNESRLTGYANTTDFWNTKIGFEASTTQNITGIYDMVGGAWEYVAGVIRTENKESITGDNETNNSGFIGIYGNTIDGEQKRLTEEEGGLPWKENRYYDFYEYNSKDTNFSKRILGDATSELGSFEWATNHNVGSWYHSHSYFVTPKFPWFMRGGYDLIQEPHATLFVFSGSQGSESKIISFRIVLAP